jgi:hypothetical protein
LPHPLPQIVRNPPQQLAGDCAQVLRMDQSRRVLPRELAKRLAASGLKA